MTLKIRQLTSFIYGGYLAFIFMIFDIADCFIHFKKEGIHLIFYLGTFYLLLTIILDRQKVIKALEDTTSFSILYKREILVALLIIPIYLLTKSTLIPLLIGICHTCWMYKYYIKGY